jgi:hypothetical protein
MNVSDAAAAPPTPPLTGASIMAAFFAVFSEVRNGAHDTASATCRAVGGSIVDASARGASDLLGFRVSKSGMPWRHLAHASQYLG